MTIPACTHGACQQGRKSCPCPDACQLPEADIAEPSKAIVYAAFILIALVVIAAAVSPLFFI